MLLILIPFNTSSAVEKQLSTSVISLLNETGVKKPTGITMNKNGEVLFSSAESHKLYMYSDGKRKLFAGFNVFDSDDEPLAGLHDSTVDMALFQSPAGLDIDSDGNIYVADAGNHAIRMISTDGNVVTLAGDGVFGDSDGKVASARFHEPMDIAVSEDGTIFVADTLNHVIRKISTNGEVTTLTKQPNRLVEIYGTLVLNGGDYQDGEISDALFNEPSSLVIDVKGNLIVSDSGNHVIRYIDFEKNEVSTLAGRADVDQYNDTTLHLEGGYEDGNLDNVQFDTPKGLALTTGGNLLITDSGNSQIRYLDLKNGSVQSLTADGDLLYPTDIHVMKNGDLIVTDTRGNDVKKIILWKKPDDFGSYIEDTRRYDDEKKISPSARDVVYQVQRLGIMTGSATEAYLFSPTTKLTRAQFSKMIVNHLNLKLVADENVFSDVKNDEWYAPYIHTAAAYGIINGYGDGTFKPNTPITRQQIAVMIGRAHNWTVDKDESIYEDQTSISAEALPYIHALHEKGIMTGYEDGTFKPESNVLRETAAVIMANLIR